MLSRVHIATPEQLLEMSHEQANPKNAVVSVLTLYALSLLKFLPLLTTVFFSFSQGTLDVGLIDSVCASDNPDR